MYNQIIHCLIFFLLIRGRINRCICLWMQLSGSAMISCAYCSCMHMKFYSAMEDYKRLFAYVLLWFIFMIGLKIIRLNREFV